MDCPASTNETSLLCKWGISRGWIALLEADLVRQDDGLGYLADGAP